MLTILDRLDIREFRLLLAGLGLVVTAVAVATTLLPGAKAFRSATQAVAVLQEAQENSADLEQQLLDRETNIEELRYRLHGDMADLPIKQVESYVIGRLQKISWQNEVELVSVEPAAGQPVQIFREMLFNIELVGEYNDVYRWLWDVKNELGFVVVKEYGMNRRDDVDTNPRLLTKVSLASYRAQE